MAEWVDGTDGWMDGQVAGMGWWSGWMGGWAGGSLVWVSGWTDGWAGTLGRGMSRWTDGWIKTAIRLCQQKLKGTKASSLDALSPATLPTPRCGHTKSEFKDRGHAASRGLHVPLPVTGIFLLPRLPLVANPHSACGPQRRRVTSAKVSPGPTRDRWPSSVRT